MPSLQKNSWLFIKVALEYRLLPKFGGYLITVSFRQDHSIKLTCTTTILIVPRPVTDSYTWVENETLLANIWFWNSPRALTEVRTAELRTWEDTVRVASLVLAARHWVNRAPFWCICWPSSCSRKICCSRIFCRRSSSSGSKSSSRSVSCQPKYIFFWDGVLEKVTCIHISFNSSLAEVLL